MNPCIFAVKFPGVSCSIQPYIISFIQLSSLRHTSVEGLRNLDLRTPVKDSTYHLKVSENLADLEVLS